MENETPKALGALQVEPPRFLKRLPNPMRSEIREFPV